MKKLRLLAFVDYYLPGYKGGGPVHSVSRLVSKLRDTAECFVFTRERDLGEDTPYLGIEPGEWKEGRFYAQPEQLRADSILRAIQEVAPDVIYLNSYFSVMTRAVLSLRAKGKLPGIGLVIAPRGEFSPGALRLKRFKKLGYIKVAGLLGYHRDLTWHVSSVHELAATRAAVGGEPKHFIKSPDLATISACPAKPKKRVGEARFAFISRIGPKKNLLQAIEMLRDVQGDVLFTIYGPPEDKSYWAECQSAMARVSGGQIRFDYRGGIPAAEVAGELALHHFFLFPTLGENFGHVIAEALAAGCPALLSDQTPWLDLEDAQAGWVMALDQQRVWMQCLQRCVDMDADEFECWSSGARRYYDNLAERSNDPAVDLRNFASAA